MTDEERTVFYGKTATDVVARWDRGDTIWSVERGGMGPGYEQAIQILVVELLRDMQGIPFDPSEAWTEKANETVHRINDWPGCGFSGAQVGAAMGLAYRGLRDGWAATLRDAKEAGQDLIQVSKVMPHAPVAK